MGILKVLVNKLGIYGKDRDSRKEIKIQIKEILEKLKTNHQSISKINIYHCNIKLVSNFVTMLYLIRFQAQELILKFIWVWNQSLKKKQLSSRYQNFSKIKLSV